MQVIFALSGYLNPLRTDLREAAMSMGAKYSADWSAKCTHLCANFGNTPKIREAENDNATVIFTSPLNFEGRAETFRAVHPPCA